jgi:hypothetical protein
MTSIPERAEGLSANMQFFEIAGRFFSAQANNPEVSGLLSRFVSSLYVEPHLEVVSGLECQLYASDDEPAPLAEDSEAVPVPHGLFRRYGNQSILEIDKFRVAFGSANAQRVDVWLKRPSDKRDRVMLRFALSYAVQAALRRCGIFDLHAAGMTHPETGEGVLLAGPSGSGKSSLSVRLASAGWKYQSDDITVIFERGSRAYMRGLRRPFAISKGSLALAVDRPLDGLVRPIAADPAKVRVNPSDIFPGAFSPEAEPGAIFFLELTGKDTTEISPISSSDAMSLLIQSSPWSIYDEVVNKKFLAAIAQLVRQTRAFSLKAGHDVFNDAKRAAKLLSLHLAG